MGTKNNPGDYDCYDNAEQDEPMFVLLARDPQAPGVVRHWACERILAGEEDLAKIREALTCASNMEEWRKEHRG